MSIGNQPDNINMLSPLGYRFVVQKLPTVNYFCQTVAIPSIGIQAIPVPTPFAALSLPGGRVQFDPLTVRFKVDEDLKNYLEIYNWIIGLGHPESLEQTRKLSFNAPIPSAKEGTHASMVSDASLVILTSHKNPQIKINFVQLYPVTISEVNFDSTDNDVIHIEATATFNYQRFTIERME